MKSGTRILMIVFAVMIVAGVAGCAKYNTFWNAKKAFSDAEHIHKQRLKSGEDAAKPTATQIVDYNRAIKKCQKMLEEYPGHGLTDDALFMMAKAYYRIQSYRMSISRLDLLFTNFPSNKFMEEALYIQAANHLLIGDISGANEYLVQLQQQFPESRFQAEALKVGGDNAYAAEQWDQARGSYEQYLELYSEDENAPQAGYNLGHCYWKLGDYELAHDRLEAVVAGQPTDLELLFNVRLLKVRCLARMGRYPEATALADELTAESEVHLAQGPLTLAKAETLILQDNYDEAAPLLENMPADWITGDVTPRLGELLGGVYLHNWDLENAQAQYQKAVSKPRVLDDPQYCKRIADALSDFNNTAFHMDTAGEDALPTFKLVQANILLFHLERPDLALELYRDIASTAEFDSTSSARGLYGAAIIYRDHTAQPDSVDAMLAQLRRDYPDSPQTFMLDPDTDHDLYVFVMEQDRLARELQIAEVSESVTEEIGVEDIAPIAPVHDPGARYSRWRERKLRRTS
jgi:outer membrane protein assembly factor BamD (BamD/ComL family)